MLDGVGGEARSDSDSLPVMKVHEVRLYQWILAFVALINLIDIAIHIGANRVEPYRVTANVAIVVATSWVFFYRPTQAQLIGWGGLAAYLILNLISIALVGIGVVGLGLIAVTTVLTCAAMLLSLKWRQ